MNFLEDWAREVDEDGLRPYLTQNFGWTAETPLPLVDGRRLPTDPLRPVSAPEGSVRRMLSDLVFRNLVLIKRQRLQIVQRRSGQTAQLIHQKDLGEGYGETKLPYALSVKYPNASKEWLWQFVFPAS